VTATAVLPLPGLEIGGSEWPHGGPYRYWLTRTWQPSGPLICFIMLNPSTATAQLNDPTVTRCCGFARREGYGRLVIVNLFALRSPHPRVLAAHKARVGPGNDDAIITQTRRAELVVAAWGAHGADPWATRRRDDVLTLLDGIPLHHLGLTRDGQPAHPLMLRGDTPLTRWQT
jgi:hypothetical protein